MHLTRLALTHFRNYRQLDLALGAPLVLIQGQNAQGKTNLLEAIHMLATSKPVHAQHEREIVDWLAQAEPIPYSRLVGNVQIAGRATELEIVLTAKGDGVNYTKQVKINGVPKRSLDLVGLLRAALFLPEDVKLVDGAPGERRRYVDIALCQIDRNYTRTLSDYNKVVTQRNSLLKTLRDQEVRPTSDAIDAQLGFWDEKLVQHGAAVIARRHNYLLELDTIARQRHAELSDGREQLQLHYLPSFNPGSFAEADFAFFTNEQMTTNFGEAPHQPLTTATVAAAFATKLRSRRPRELAAGSTLYGPHRDDLRFVTNRSDLRAYGSRGQQRTAALSLKLAELEVSKATTGVAPLLLLDDVMSELDGQRRTTLLQALQGVEQAIITTTDWADFTPAFRSQAQRLQVQAGVVQVV